MEIGISNRTIERRVVMENKNILTNEKEWNYEVSLTDLKTVDNFGRILGSKKATVDKETGSILGIVSPYYKIVQNKTLFDVMQEIGQELDLTLNNINVCKNKSVTIFKYGFGEKNNTSVKSSEPNDRISFGVEFINSFDSRWGSSKFRAFANRLICLNGMTLPREIAQFSFSSLKEGFSGGRIQQELTNRISPLVATSNIWNSWAQVTPSRIKVGEFISGNLGKTASENILKRYDSSTDKTLWGLYNLVTYFITHEVETDNPKDLRFRQYNMERLCDKFYEVDLV